MHTFQSNVTTENKQNKLGYSSRNTCFWKIILWTIQKFYLPRLIYYLPKLTSLYPPYQPILLPAELTLKSQTRLLNPKKDLTLTSLFWDTNKILSAAAAAKSLQSCPTLCDPIDSSAPGSPVPGILQARTLEWVAISFSNAWKWKVKVKLLSSIWLLATPWTAAYLGHVLS